MANGLYDVGNEALARSTIDWANDDIRVVLTLKTYTPDLANHRNLEDIPAAQRFATSAATTGRTITSGVYALGDVEIAATANGIAYGLAVYLYTGVESTSTLIAWFESAAGLPATFTAGETKTLDFGTTTTPVRLFVRLKPDADSAVGPWLNEVGSTPLWSSIDEAVADDDTTYVEDAHSIGVGTACEMTIENPPSTPTISAGHILRIRWKTADDGSPTGGTLFNHLRQAAATKGSNVIAFGSSTDTPYRTDEHVFSAAEVASITDYNALTIYLRLNGSGAGDVHVIVTQSYFQVPQARILFPVPEIVTSALVETATEIVILVDVTFVDSDGANPVTFQFSDLFYYDSTTSPVTTYRPLIKSISGPGFTRASGNKLRGGSTPDGGKITILPTPELLAALDGLNCERQALTIRKGRPGDPISRFDSWVGMAEGHEASGSLLTIEPFNYSKLFEVDAQQRRWEGRGRRVQMSESTAPGWVLVEAPADSSWAASTSLALTWVGEFYNAASTEEAFLAIHPSGLGDVLRLYRKSSGVVGLDWEGSSYAGTSDISAANLYRVGLWWNGSTVKVYVDGVEDISQAEAAAITPVDLTVGTNSSLDAMAGAAEDVRMFVDGDITAGYLTDHLAYDAPPGLDTPTGLVLRLPLSEGIGNRTYDPDREHVGTLEFAAAWVSSRAGDAELANQRQPLAFGYAEDAEAILVDKIEQIYAVHFDAVSNIVPKVGGRRLAGAWAESAGVVTFDETARTIHSTTGTQLSKAVPYQTIRIAGSTSNDADYKVVGEPRQVATGWAITVGGDVVDETGGTGVISIISVSAFFTEVSTTGEGAVIITDVPPDVSRTITADFDADQQWVRSTTDLSAFPIWSLIEVSGGANDGAQFRLINSPWFDSFAALWYLYLDSAPTDETAGSVTLFTVDTGGEYSLDLARGQFTLFFLATKPVTARVWGDATGSGYVDTAPEIAERIMGTLGSTDSQALAVDSTHLAELAAAYPWECGVYYSGAGETSLAEVLDFVLQGIGLHWFVSPLTGEFNACDLPPTTSPVVTKYLAAQTRATSLKPTRAHKARSYVEVLWGRNSKPLELSDIDYYVQFDRSPSGQAVLHDLRREWQSAQFPATPTDDSLQPDTIESPITNLADAEALAESLYTRLMGFTNSFYDVGGLLEWQAVEPWLTVVKLSDEETPGLAAERDAYLVTCGAAPWSTRLLLMVIEA